LKPTALSARWFADSTSRVRPRPRCTRSRRGSRLESCTAPCRTSGRSRNARRRCYRGRSSDCTVRRCSSRLERRGRRIDRGRTLRSTCTHRRRWSSSRRAASRGQGGRGVRIARAFASGGVIADAGERCNGPGQLPASGATKPGMGSRRTSSQNSRTSSFIGSSSRRCSLLSARMRRVTSSLRQYTKSTWR